MSKLGIVLESAFIMFLCSAGIGAAHLWKAGPLTFASFIIALVVPALATLAFLAVSLLIPDLFAEGRLKFPLVVTLPLIFVALLAVVLILFSRVGVGIASMPERMEPITIWGKPWLLFIVFFGSFLALSAVGALNKSNPDQNDSPL